MHSFTQTLIQADGFVQWNTHFHGFLVVSQMKSTIRYPHVCVLVRLPIVSVELRIKRNRTVINHKCTKTSVLLEKIDCHNPCVRGYTRVQGKLNAMNAERFERKTVQVSVPQSTLTREWEGGSWQDCPASQSDDINSTSSRVSAPV